MEQSPSGSNTLLVREIPTIDAARRFIIAFTKACQWIINCAKRIQSTPSHPISLSSILILPCHLHLGLPSRLFLSGFPTKVLYEFLISHASYMAVHIILITLIIFVEAYKLRGSLCSLFQPPAISSLLRFKYSSQHLIRKHPQSVSFP